MLASGLVDRKPDIPGIDAAITRSLVRICPICDAYEAIDRRIAVIGDGELGAREARFLRTYSDSVTVLHVGPPTALGDRPKLAADGIAVLDTAPQAISLREHAVTVAGVPARDFDYLYLALGCDMQSRLALGCGAAHDAANNVVVDAHQQTSVDGLYAAGDVVRGLNQIAVAAAEAAIAATAIHNRLQELQA